MGVELTKHLHLKGYKVALVDSHESAGPEIVLEIGDYENVQFFRADMTSYRSQAATFQRIHQIWGRLDLCFLHAGISGNSLARIDQGREIGVLETPPEPDVSSPETSACKEIVYGVQLATHLMRCNSPQIGGRIIVVAGISNHCSGTSHTEEPSPTVITTQYVQSIAPSLKVEMKILLNMVRSDAIATPSWSREHVEVVSPRRLDSIRDVLEACDRLTEDETGISGEVLDI
jgi:NAD(P)-dependent dehydrogenase (short-subunit alcohol dehydrogenase family)